MQGLGPDGTYSLKNEFTEVAPAPTILLEGAYSASPFLRDLIDLAVIVDVPTKVRHERTAAREQGAEGFLEEIRRLDLLIALRADSNSGKASRRDELLVQCFELMTETLDTQ